MPGRAMQANRLQVLLHPMVILDLSWNRNGHRVAAGRANKFGRPAVSVKEEAKVLNNQTEDLMNQWKKVNYLENKNILRTTLN